MADLKISQLPSAITPLAGTEVLPIVQSSATKQVSIANLTAGRSVSVADATLTTGNLVIGTSGKGIDFSATSNAGGMTSELLADYEEGTFTPTISCATPNDLSVSYSIQIGRYTKVGNRVFIQLVVVTSAFTYTTAAGVLRIENLPYVSNNTSNNFATMSLWFKGITKAGYTQFVPYTDFGYSRLLIGASASGSSNTSLTISDTPSGGTPSLIISGHYQV